MKKILSLSLILSICFVPLTAQHLAAYLDYMDRFYVFDAGEKKQLEHFRIHSYQVGGSYVAFLNYHNDFKVYDNGRIITLENAPPTEYTVTDHLVGYNMFSVLKAYDGKKRTLCNNTRGYIVEDSLIAYYDQVQQVLNVYHGGETLTLEDGLLQWPITSYSSGDNILAYITEFDNKFKIYYRGEVIVLDENVRETVYKAGRDIVAYMNLATNAFMVFYKSHTYELEAFKPESFQMGDEMMAWVNVHGDFKVFQGGETTTVRTFPPESYQLKDSTLVFIEDGFLKTWCDGEVYEIERYVPPKWDVSERTIAYIDYNDRVQAFRRCKKEQISLESVNINSFDMIRNLIIYNVGVNTVKIWWNGKEY